MVEHAEGKKRVVIENVRPAVDCGAFSIKRVVGEEVVVKAVLFADGHDALSARVLYRHAAAGSWREAVMKYVEHDCWQGTFRVELVGIYAYTVMGWIDRFTTWQRGVKHKSDASQDVAVDLLAGIEMMSEASTRASGGDRKQLSEYAEQLKTLNTRDAIALALGEELTGLMGRYADTRHATRYDKELTVTVDRKKALFSTWYERFPRSCAREAGKDGTFRDCEHILPEVARMGFDVLYFPPIHPIGTTNRKGKNNSLRAEPGDVGSPWAIGSDEGGHKAVHPCLGSMEDFVNLVKKAQENGIEIALDLAFQCSPDHPYVREHPEWFSWRPDGSIQFAENPPKKYEDIVPINFATEEWQSLWEELKSVVLFWVEKGVRIFRVDNPHTKPFRFWEWLIREIKTAYPEVMFLSEAFTRPKVMHALAKVGFTQSYTYFTWRNTKQEFSEYLHELLHSEVREYFRPNFWTNTPDILPEHMQYGGKPIFMIRLILAATLSSSYGMYGPTFELCVNEALPDREEYADSEKYEIKHWDWDSPGNLKELIARMNRIRRENPALQTTWNLKFYEVDNEYLLFYGKATEDGSNMLLMVVNLDPFHTQAGWVKIPLDGLGLDPRQPFLVHDLISDDKYIWQGERNYVELNPHIFPAHVFRVRKRLKRETDFDYFM